MSSPYAVVVCVGPEQREVDRLIDLAASHAAHEPARPSWLVMVDDHPSPRGLDTLAHAARHITPVALHHPRHNAATPKLYYGKGICAAVLQALNWVAGNSGVRFVLKVDTDSLVIAPFADRIESFLAAHPRVGLIGAHDRTPNGERRDFSPVVAALEQVVRLRLDWRRPRATWRAMSNPKRRMIVRLLRRARRNGYVTGEHCLGGGYALSREALVRIARGGWLARFADWIGVDLSEDAAVALLVRAAGLGLANFVSPGDVFGVRYQGLPALPQDLLDRRYAVIHAVKNDPRISEPDIRDFFRQKRI